MQIYPTSFESSLHNARAAFFFKRKIRRRRRRRRALFEQNLPRLSSISQLFSSLFPITLISLCVYKHTRKKLNQLKNPATTTTTTAT